MMKKLTLFLMLIIAAMISNAVEITRTANVRTGETVLSSNFAVSVVDTVAASDTILINVECFQHYPFFADVYLTFDTITATGNNPDVDIYLYGKVFEGDAWAAITTSAGSYATWDKGADNPIRMTSTASHRYRYFQIRILGQSGCETVYLTAFDFKIWFTGGQLSVDALTDGVVTFTAGALAGATTGAFSGNVTVGGTLVTTGAITANGGVTLGAGDDLIGSSTSDITINTDKFTVAGADGNTLIGGTLTVAGLLTANGGVTLGAGDDLIGSSTSDITINTDKFTVSGADGDVLIGRDADVVRNLTAGTIASDANVTATTSFNIGDFKFIVQQDTLCSVLVTSTDTIRIHPPR